jgi:hypothetical protein
VPVLLTSRDGGRSRPPFDALNLGDHVGDDPAAVAANRRVLDDRLGIPVQFMRQVHGAEVAVVRQVGPAPVADALVTDVPGIALAVLVADCVPMTVTAPGVVAVVHAGRAGAVAGVVPAVLGVFDTMGVDRAAVAVTLGPAICGACYEVPVAMRDEVEAALPGSAAATPAGTPGVDLRAGLVRQLAAHGVGDVSVSARCTAQDPGLFSHRRDGVTGRFAAVAWM